MNNNPVDLNVSLTADVTKPVEKTVSTLAKYFDIPPKAISRMGQTTSGLLGLLDEKINQKRLDIKFLGETRRLCALQQIEKRQNDNINSIVSKALNFSSHANSDVSDQEVSIEWLNFFFENAKNISTKDLQLIWAKILSGEISNPGDFSIKTFDILKCLDQNTALSFQKIAKYSCKSYDGSFIPIGINNLHKFYKLTHGEQLKLIEAGLIHEQESTIAVTHGKEEKSMRFMFGNYEILVESKSSLNSNGVTYQSIITFTQAGSELSTFVEHVDSLENIPIILKHFVSNETQVFIKEKSSQEWLELRYDDEENSSFNNL